MDKVFVSHSSADKKIVDSFVSNILRLGIHLEEENIFCTSSEGMGIKSGDDWRYKIKDEINSAKVILLLISPNYKSSEVCLNEMGAAWLSNAKVIPLIIGDVTYSSVGVIVEPMQAEKINELGLDHLQEAMEEYFPHIKEKFKSSSWGNYKRKFLSEMRKLESEHPFPIIYSNTEMSRKIEELKDLEKKYDELIGLKDKLEGKIKRLKQYKDSKEVENVEKEYENTNVLDKFRDLIHDANQTLRNVSAVVRTIIYNQRYGRGLEIGIGFHSELRDAEARCFIEYTGEGYIPIYKKKIMCDIRESIDALEEFIDNLDVDEKNILTRQYDIIDIRDSDFWTDVIAVSLDHM